MKAPALLLLLGLIPCTTAAAPQQKTVSLTGFVTRVASASDFDVNAIRIRCGGKTEITWNTGTAGNSRGCPRQEPFVGQPVSVHGVFDFQDRSLSAERLELTTEGGDKISGAAVILALPEAATAAGANSLLVRADGYRILLSSQTKVTWKGSLASLAAVQPGDWIEYKGELRRDGVVAAREATLSLSKMSPGEDRFRAKSDYDPSKVPADAKQNPLREVFAGVDYKKIPPDPDPAMQARITAIGNKLIPAFQRSLPDTDAEKIRFRFQLVNEKKWHDGRTLPSGIILVPHAVVDRMQNDSQLAAILADNIACALERQTYRMQSAAKAVGAGEIASDVAGAFIPGVGLVAPAMGITGGKVMLAKERNQSGRVSLGLLHDAGYDIDQAPIAWWLLAADKGKPLSEIPLPSRAANLYRLLGEEWHNPAAAPAARHPSNGRVLP